MCGRTCCTLQPQAIPYACTTVTGPKVPDWKDAPCGGHYEPSTNVPPTAFTPILYNNCERLTVQPMMWGIVPPWHRGSSTSGHGLTTNNARLEGLAESKLYKPSLEEDRRCVIICDGFYEWQRTMTKTGDKQPFLVFAPQDNNQSPAEVQLFAKANVMDHWKEDKHSWTGPRLLFLAGLYSLWYSDEDRMDKQRPVFSYTVITREANETLAWLHDRMPAILPDAESVSAWLDPDSHGFDALKVLQQPVAAQCQVTWYPVSREVGNVRNKDTSLCAKVNLDEAKLSKSEKKAKDFMANWLAGGGRKRKHQDD